ncbi:MAG: urease accessory protein UreF [Cellulosilyticum sp.]|nr:urease accessory protein UreF [Cellulosilyticum sp.]
MNVQNNFYLLQINDALFPIGGYSHSYGLETYIQKGLIQNTQDAVLYLHNKLQYSILYSDLLGARLAYEYAKKEDLDALIHLNQLTHALKTPAEIRDASIKLGSRFLKTIHSLIISYESEIFNQFTSASQKTPIHHCCLYGIFCAALGMDESEILRHYLYAQTSAIVTNCVKSIPLSQTDGQKILSSSFPVLLELLERVMTLTEDWYGCASPGFDIRCMQHEGLYSRIYMS